MHDPKTLGSQLDQIWWPLVSRSWNQGIKIETSGCAEPVQNQFEILIWAFISNSGQNYGLELSFPVLEKNQNWQDLNNTLYTEVWILKYTLRMHLTNR